MNFAAWFPVNHLVALVDDVKYFFVQSVFHLCQSVAKTSFNAVTAFASCALVMVSGGVKLMTLPYSPSGRKINPRCKRVLIAVKVSAVAGEPSWRRSSTPAIRPRPRA